MLMQLPKPSGRQVEEFSWSFDSDSRHCMAAFRYLGICNEQTSRIPFTSLAAGNGHSLGTSPSSREPNNKGVKNIIFSWVLDAVVRSAH